MRVCTPLRTEFRLWRIEFSEAVIYSTDVDALGYPYVPLRDKDTLHDAANWISETLHHDDFAYNSFGFWFNTKEDAMLFKLVWG